jgi:hypothetical protein
MKRKPRTYSEKYVKDLWAKIRELEAEKAQHDISWQAQRAEVRRYEQLVDHRWDEMQRLRDLVYAIATGKPLRNVVERELQQLGGAITPKERT